MRVIAGKARSLPLKTIPGMDTRPTTDRIKETLFNMLQNHLYEASFLDLFAGSGSLSFEALSRGAQEVCLVEREPKVVQCLNQNVEALDVSDRCRVAESDVLRFLRGRAYQPYDVIFADPPYHNEQLSTVKKLLGLLKVGGSMILSNSGRGGILEETGIVVVDNRSYSNAYITLYRRDS